MNTLHILGAAWALEYATPETDPKLELCDGYTDWTIQKIVVRDFAKGKPEDMDLSDLEAVARNTARHEIIHAFLCESGLRENSADTDAWAANEEMIDWFAIMGERIHQAWREAEVLG